MTGTIPESGADIHAALDDETGRLLDDLRELHVAAGHPDDPAFIMASAIRLMWCVVHGVAVVQNTDDGPPVEAVH